MLNHSKLKVKHQLRKNNALEEDFRFSHYVTLIGNWLTNERGEWSIKKKHGDLIG